MSKLHKDWLFASLDADLHLERIAGGNETEVYSSDDRRYVVKVKHEEVSTLAAALHRAKLQREAAYAFAEAIGANHSIPSYLLVAENSAGQVQPVVVQPYYHEAVALFAVDYARLTDEERRWIARQLLAIMWRNILTYWRRGWMPDIYGRSNASTAERKRLNGWRMLPWRLWSFLVKRNLLRSHNLLLTAAPERRIVLVDYDPVPHGPLYQFAYYHMRLLLFLRDLVLILVMVGWGYAPEA